MNVIRPMRTISALVVTVVTFAVLSGLIVFGGLFVLAMDPSSEVSLVDMVVVSAVCAALVFLVGLAVVAVYVGRVSVPGTCLQCGPSREGLTGNRCPECGNWINVRSNDAG